MKGSGTERAAIWLARCAYGICLAVTVLALMLTAIKADAGWAALAQGVILALALAAALWWAGRLAGRLNWRIVLALLLCLCLALRLFWVLRHPIEPMGDYEVFHAYALRLAREGNLNGMWTRYLALFPHIFGYSWFLSLCYKLFPAAPMTAALVNTALSTVSCALVYLLARRLSGEKAAAGAALLWALFPSQIIYNMFVLSEPLYTTLLLAVLWLAAVFDGKAGRDLPARDLALGALAGLGLALVNLCRPVAAIVLIAFALWLGPVRLEKWREKDWRRDVLCFLLALAVVYFAAGRAGSAYADARIGEKTASTPGYNILVGFNPDSEGTWNQADSDLLYAIDAEPGSTAASTQAQMLNEARLRITSGEVDFGKLFASKLRTFLGRDSACVDYAASVLTQREFLSGLCDSAWTAALLLAAVGLARGLKRKDRSALFPAMLYLVGLTLAHMLVEVAPRYHYSLLIPLVLLALQGVQALGELTGKTWGRLRAR